MQIVQELVTFLRAKDAMIVFLSKTWPNEAWLERIRCRLGSYGKFVVEGETLGGSLVLFWKSALSISVDSYSFESYRCYCR